MSIPGGSASAEERWTFWALTEWPDSLGEDAPAEPAFALAAGQGPPGLCRAQGHGPPHLLYTLLPELGLFVPNAAISDDAHKPLPDWYFDFGEVSLVEAGKLALRAKPQFELEHTLGFNSSRDWFGAAEAPMIPVSELLGRETADRLSSL